MSDETVADACIRKGTGVVRVGVVMENGRELNWLNGKEGVDMMMTMLLMMLVSASVEILRVSVSVSVECCHRIVWLCENTGAG